MDIRATRVLVSRSGQRAQMVPPVDLQFGPIAARIEVILQVLEILECRVIDEGHGRGGVMKSLA